jgi:hypothetical protein
MASTSGGKASNAFLIFSNFFFFSLISSIVPLRFLYSGSTSLRLVIAFLILSWTFGLKIVPYVPYIGR